MSTKPKTAIDAEYVRDISVLVFKMRLEAPSGGGKGAVARMIEADKDNGEKLRSRAACYDALTRCYLEIAQTTCWFPAVEAVAVTPTMETADG